MKLYGYKKCSSCRDAEKLLKSAGIDFEFIDITTTPPSASELRQILKISGLELKKLWNTSGDVYRSMGLKDKLPNMNEEQCLELLSREGRLIKRPLITDGKVATVGANLESMKVWTR